MLTTCAQTGTNCLSSLSCGKQLEKNDLLRAWRACACKNFNTCQQKHANPSGFHLPLVLQLYRQTCKVEIKPHKCTTCNMLCRPGGLPILFVRVGWVGWVGGCNSVLLHLHTALTTLLLYLQIQMMLRNDATLTTLLLYLQIQMMLRHLHTEMMLR